MKRLFRIFELSKNEQRVALIVMFILLALAFGQYERRIHRFRIQPTSQMEASPSPSPLRSE